MKSSKREEILKSYLPLVEIEAKIMARKCHYLIHYKELISSGYIGLHDAFNKFDKNKNCSFKHYATFRIKGEMLDYLRRMDLLPRLVRRRSNRIERARNAVIGQGKDPTNDNLIKQLGITKQEFDGWVKRIYESRTFNLGEQESLLSQIAGYKKYRDQDDTIDLIQKKELYQLLMNGLRKLPEREYSIIMKYFIEGKCMLKIAEDLNVTESRISQIIGLTLPILKNKLKHHRQELLAG